MFLVENDTFDEIFLQSGQTNANKKIVRKSVSEIVDLFSFFLNINKASSFNLFFLLSPSYYLHKEQLSSFVGSSRRPLQIKTKIMNNYLFLKPALITD